MSSAQLIGPLNCSEIEGPKCKREPVGPVLGQILHTSWRSDNDNLTGIRRGCGCLVARFQSSRLCTDFSPFSTRRRQTIDVSQIHFLFLIPVSFESVQDPLIYTTRVHNHERTVQNQHPGSREHSR